MAAELGIISLDKEQATGKCSGNVGKSTVATEPSMGKL